MDVEIVLDQNDGPGVREVDIYSTCSSERLLSACKTSIRNITIASSGFLPALLFLISSGVSTTASMSTRKLSQGTRRSIASSGSPFADSAPNRLSASNNPNCPILASANHAITHEIRTARQQRLFFEMPYCHILCGGRRIVRRVQCLVFSSWTITVCTEKRCGAPWKL